MKEQLISFECAKLAKEKGFDIPCFSFYRDNGDLHGIGGKPAGTMPPYLSGINNQIAPTQSLLQKWLREEKNINIWVLPASAFGKDKTWWDSIVDGQFAGQTCNTYEEALEEGLKEALKLLTK